MTLINHGLKSRQPDIGTVEAECEYCHNVFHEDDIVSGEDGETFCSEDCRNEYQRDRAADRAERWSDLD